MDVNKLPSRPFQGFDCSEQENVTHLIEYLYGEYAAWYKGKKPDGRLRKPKEVKRHLTHFVLEAFRTYRALPGMSLGVHLGNDYYNKEGDRYHPDHLSYRIVINVTDFLVASGYLDMPFGKGEWDADPSEGWLTRFQPMDVLMHLCHEYSINLYMIKRCRDPEIIIMHAKRERRNGKKLPPKTIEYEDTQFTMQARSNLRRINEFIAGHNINLAITDEQEEALRHRMLKQNDPTRDKYLDFSKTRLRRIFNNDSFEQGGRFYDGWWQQIPSEYRHFITIDDEPTVELDYSEMHFAIMYADIGMDIPMEDAYALEGYDAELRSHIKKAFHIIVNCANRKHAIETINGCIQDGELSGELGDGWKLLEAFEEAHPRIKDKIASGEGVRGQFIDSQIAEQILLKGMELDLCILPIHDGFIMVKRLADVLEGLMHEAIMEVIGHPTYVKPELPDLSSIPHVLEYIKHLNDRPDGEAESNDPRMNPAFSMANKERRDRDWKEAHGE